MLSAAEIARGSTGAVRLLQRDAAGPLYFENTMEACLRSFRVMALVAPIYAAYMLLYYQTVEVTADPGEVVAVEVLRYLIDWLLFPVLFYEIARRRRWLDRYPRYISALNWINLPVMVVALVGLAITIAVPRSAAFLVDLALRVLLFYWFLIATRLALGVGWLIAVLLLIVDWVPSLLLSLVVGRFLGISPLSG